MNQLPLGNSSLLSALVEECGRWNGELLASLMSNGLGTYTAALCYIVVMGILCRYE